MLIPTLLSVALAGITEEGQLENTARPTHQHVTLEIDPFRKAYAGHTTITLDVDEPTDSLTLHADGLFITKARLGGGARVIPEPDGAVTLEFKKTVPAGRATLEIDFLAKYGHTSVSRFSPWEFAYWDAKGKEQIERDKEAKRFASMGRTLSEKTVEELEAEEKEHKRVMRERKKDPDTASQVTAMLRPGSARYAFPSFDEPQIRSTFQLEIVTPPEYRALTNMPLTSREAGKKGWVRHRFRKSPEMPAQMVGFAVGKMESKPIVGADVPGKLYYQPGIDRAYEEELLAQFEEPMKAMGEWFGDAPFPERNVFLMGSGEPTTGVETLGGLAVYPANTLGKSPDYYVHPAAHSWFGGVVSPKTWSDVWLMEAMATFVDHQVGVGGPDADFAVERLVWQIPQGATSDPIVKDDVKREDVSIGGTAGSSKATLILQMLDGYGPGRVRKGVLAWLDEGGASDLDGLLEHLAPATGFDAAVLNAWFENPGLPLVTLRRTGGRFTLTSEPFAAWHEAPEQEDTEEEEPPEWTVPFAARTAGGKVKAAVAPRGGAVVAEGWVMPTQPAYAFVFEDPADLDALVGAHALLTPAEHLYLLANLEALLKANAVTPERAVHAARELGKTAPPEAVGHIIELVGGLRLVPREDRRATLESLRPVIDALGARLDASHPSYPWVQFVRFELGHTGSASVLESYAKQALDDPDALTFGQLTYGMFHHGLGKNPAELDEAFERIDDEFEEHPEVYYPLIQGIGWSDADTREKIGVWLMKKPDSDERFDVFESLFRPHPDETLAWMEKYGTALLRIPEEKRAAVLDIALEGVCDPGRVDAVARVARRYDGEEALDVLASKRIEAEACQTWRAESREAFLSSLEVAH